MSLLDLLYLDETKSDTVISAVRKWCTENGCEIGSAYGKRAIAVAVRLAKSADGGDGSFLAALSQEMSVISDQRSLGLIMIVEDEPLIAMDLEQTLQSAGFKVEIFTSCSDAITWLADHTPSAAVLDIRLRDGSCALVASLLEDRAIQFVVCSGSEKADADAVFTRSEWLSKPCDPHVLVDAVKNAVTQAVDEMMEASS